MDLRNMQHAILQLADTRGAKNVRSFGSAARGNWKPGSDLDLLVEMEPGRSLIDRVALKQDLENLLGCGVDVVTEKSLHGHIR